MIELTQDEVSGAMVQAIADRTGLPLTYLRGELDCQAMEQLLAERIVGQQVARRKVLDILEGVALRHERRSPIANLMLVGPTGVGKTELALALARAFFGGEDRVTRLDCSEFSESFTVSSLVGSAPGYVGYHEGGRLTEAIRNEPFQLVLFDEIEKAHREIYPLLLQLMDAGRLTDRAGLTVDFRHTLVVFTSNLGATGADEACGLRVDRGARMDPERYLRAVREYFAPEFVGRLSAIIPFQPLGLEDVSELLRRFVSDLERRAQVEFRIGDLAWRVLCQRGTSVEEGARRARRLVEHDLAAAVSRLKARPGARIAVDLDDDGGLSFAVEDEEKPAAAPEAGAAERSEAQEDSPVPEGPTGGSGEPQPADPLP